MDPITITLIAAGATAGVGAVGAGTAALVYWLRRQREKLLPPPPPPTPEEAEKQERQEAERRRQEEEQRQRQEREATERARQREAAAKRAAEEQAAREAAFETHLDSLVAAITSTIVFTHKRVPIGYVKVGERAVGVIRRECRSPGIDTEVRPIRDVSEIALLLETEHLEEDEEWFERILTGKALVRVHIEEEQILEPIFEQQFEEKVRVLYLLLDVSPSMFQDEGAWRLPVWKGISTRLIDKARAVDAPFLMRPFSDGVRDLQRVLSEADARARKQHIRNMKPGSGTNITDAIMTAIRDFSKETYDVADIMILTDGEDNRGMDVPHVRTALETAGIRLHAVLLGVQNEGLRACTDSYVIIGSDLRVHSAVHRT